MADREDMIRKVQALWRQADDSSVSDAEKDAFVSKARDLMAKYAIDEMVLEEASGVREAVVLSDIRIFEEGSRAVLVPDQRIYLAHVIGTHNRCRSVIRRMPASIAMDGTPIKAGTYLTTVGFKSDTETVRLLYLALGVDMISAMTDEPTDHMNKSQRDNYFVNFCDGYVTRIDRRLADVNRKVHEVAESTNGMALVLRSKEVEVADTFAKMFPKLGKQKVSRFSYDPNAQERGKVAADKANIGAGRSGVGQGTRGELG